MATVTPAHEEVEVLVYGGPGNTLGHYVLKVNTQEFIGHVISGDSGGILTGSKR